LQGIAEIADLDISAFVEEDVVTLYISVDLVM
jgi:hypothetical protein